MRAIFTGRDKSMGFRNGKVYNLDLYWTKTHLWVKEKPKFLFKEKKCPYSSKDAFLNNWMILSGRIPGGRKIATRYGGVDNNEE